MTTATTTKTPVASALEVLAQLSQDSTWDDVMYHLYVREKIERSLRAAEEGRLIDHEEVFAKLLSDDDEEEADE